MIIYNNNIINFYLTIKVFLINYFKLFKIMSKLYLILI